VEFCSQGGHYVQYPNGSLLINPVQPGDQGIYTCTATSSEGVISKNVTLEVRDELEVCGVKRSHSGREKRIVEGFAVSGIHEWPWQVRL